ncbi:MAG: electron transport complex subunit RsxC [Gammaproteobacteria bacterium]|jgi:electron transport complex protein RnfC|nr:electron transport complex subunit RsxC [Gammaproteobacteria bacterium]
MSLTDAARRLFRGGVHPEQHKAESTHTPIGSADMPERLLLPLHQHIGEPAEALFAPGDRVLKGQTIARANGYVSAPLHAPTSGTVLGIGEHPVPHPSGLVAPCMVIEPDGEDRWIDHAGHDDYASIDPVALRNIIREAGIVGLGGAGFPTYIKLNPGHHKPIETLILNGAECEPYITCDDMLMRERAAGIVSGLAIVRHALQAKEALIGIEENKPEAIAAMRAAVAGLEGVRVVPVPTIYPAGDSKLLSRILTGKEIPSNKLSAHVGITCVNVGTTYAVHRAIAHGEPLLSRIVTVTGGAVAQPRNLETLLGTPMDALLRQCGTRMAAIDRLIMGGPMMGIALHRADLPVIKTTNCVLAAAAAELLPQRPAMPCIRCGACSDACPMNLLPQQLYWHARNKDLDKVQKFDLFDCIECGACSYVCPSNIPLVQYFRYAKGDIWIQEREKEKAQLARRRHDARQARIEREKAEREAKRQQKKAALDAASARERAQAEAQSARQRAEERRDVAMQQVQKQRTVPAEGTEPAATEKNEKNRAAD